MPSIAPGFEYDIFISYRHNDNRSGWVTEFVHALEEELAATVKEPLSIYFDKNPHDGLLETHNVDKSLEGKLKCLIFIPILSRTYCDLKSFAWTYEFLAFRNLNKETPPGIDVKLRNGNVGSRVLPIKIHELDSHDQMLFEKENGGALRSIDFVFKSPGVNRPLTLQDSRADNLNKTFYRDQVNKVSNSIKDILDALTLQKQIPQSSDKEVKVSANRNTSQVLIWQELINRQVLRAGFAYLITSAMVLQLSTIAFSMLELPEWALLLLTWILVGMFPIALTLAWFFELSPEGIIRTSSSQSIDNPYSASKKKPLTSNLIISLLVALLAVQYIYFNKLKKEDQVSKSPEKSIAVLPFENRGEESNDFFSDGLTEDIINKLSIVRELKVISSQAVKNYKGAGLPYQDIARELEVMTLLTGNVQRLTDRIKITVQLIDGATNKVLWGNTFQRSSSDINSIQSEIATTIAGVLQIKLTELEMNRLKKIPTENTTAYEYYLKGRSLYYNYKSQDNDLAIEQFKMAIMLDPNYALAWAGLGDAYSQMHVRFGREVGWIDSSIVAGTKAIQLDSGSSEAYKALANAYNYAHQYDKGFELLKKAVELNPTNERAVGNLGTGYFLRGEFSEALHWHKKAAGLNPKNAIPFQIIGWTYRLLGDLGKAEAWLTKSMDINNGYWDTYELLAYCYVCQGRNAEALKLIPQVLELEQDDPRTIETAALIAHFAGDKKNAKKYFKQSIENNESYRNDPNTVSSISLGQILLEEGNPVESEIYLTHAMEINRNEIHKGSQDDGPPFNIAGIYAIRGDKEQARQWLEKAVDQNWVDYAMVTHGPWFANMRYDPAIVKIVDDVKKRMATIREQEPNQ